MMPDQRSYKELLYQYEILRARLEIREHYLSTVVKEVYDNIGQVLSLIRVQLTLLRSDLEISKNEKLDSSGELVGKTIRDLRSMCQLFYPEADIMTCQGFNKAIEHEVKTLYPDAICFSEPGNKIPERINEDKGLVVFGILLEVFRLIKQQNKGKLVSLNIKYRDNKVSIVIDFSGEIIKENKTAGQADFDLSIFARAELLNGKLQIKNVAGDHRRVKLVIPIN